MVLKERKEKKKEKKQDVLILTLKDTTAEGCLADSGYEQNVCA